MSAQSMDVERAKRASTVEEESACPLTKKTKVEEDEEKEDYGDSDSDDGYIVVNHLRFKYVLPEKEPEWEVDSYDGREYKSDLEDRKYFSDEELYQEYRLRMREIFESKGFIPDLANGIYSVGSLDAPAGDQNRTIRDGILQPPSGLKTGLLDMASLCVKKFNEYKGTCVELPNWGVLSELLLVEVLNA